MSNHIGSSTIYSTILPNNAALGRIRNVRLSRGAKHRLEIMEYCQRVGNVSLTCRHYGIARSYFYKWSSRYNPHNLSSLEDLSRRPKRVRQATYNYDLIKLVRKLRTDYPIYSSKKLSVILRRDFNLSYSASTIGRIIKKFGLYFAEALKLAKARSKAVVRSWIKRKPHNLKANGPRQVIEFDMKHIWASGHQHYAFVAVDIFSKEALIRIASTPSSHQAKLALEQVLTRFGSDICVVTDNGSENFKYACAYLKDQNITQYFARPHTPKDKPHVENLIGKLQQECLNEDRTQKTSEECQIQVNGWLNDYHYFRPHQALNYLTPDEFCATLNITISRAGLSTM